MQSAYSKPLSLWRLVEQHAEPHEQDELKDMLGQSVVEQSLELHDEIDMLLEIWRDVREEASESSRPQSTLPEPPNQRDRLVQEICFFVDNVKEQAKKKGIDPEHILKKHNSEILDYAVDRSRPESARSRTSRLSDGRETPMAVLSPDRLDLAYSMTDEVQAVNKQLNFMDFGGVCVSLRSYLEKEVEQLLEDVQFLQTCLDEAADTRDCPTPRLSSREPTLTELREERSLLEKELFATEKLSSTPVVTRPMFTTSNRVLPKTPPTPKGRRSPGSPPPARSALVKPSSSQPRSAGPLRARHEVMAGLAPDRSGDFDSRSGDNGNPREGGSGMEYRNTREGGSGMEYRNMREGDIEAMFSPLSVDSSPSLDAEFFGFSESSGRLGWEDIEDEGLMGGDQPGFASHHHYQQQQQQQDVRDHQQHHQRSSGNNHMGGAGLPHGFSKLGSCLEKGKSPLSSVLPSPCTIPGVPAPAAPISTTAPTPSHSDSALLPAHTAPHPPTQRPGTVGPNRTARRRTVSPRPRFRVVDVTNLVEAAGKGDSPDIARHSAQRVISFTSSSSSSPSSAIPSPSTPLSDNVNLPSPQAGFTPSPTDVLPDREAPIRPRSANRFREMVLGCRDGQ